MNISELRSSLDRLVTGDLCETERTALIRFLEEHPEYWRDCGLAFLEAQLWSETLQSIPEPGKVAVLAQQPGAIDRPIRLSGDRQVRPKRYWAQVAVAALILLAFFGGRFLERGVQQLAMNTAESPSGTFEASTAEVALSSTKLTSPAITPESSHSSGLEASTFSPHRPEQAVTGPAGREIPLMVTTSDAGAPQVRISDYQKQLLARRGLAVATQRQYLNTRLPDGRQVAVPVEQIMVQRRAGELN